MARSWSEIRKHYEDLGEYGWEVGALLALVKHIETGKLSRGLHGWTSHADLCISQSPSLPPYEGPYLRISPRPGGKLEFRYVDTPIESKQWSRTVPATDAIPRLESFLKQLHWFSDL